ncbi:MAG: hypothetical protein LBG60_04020 [Bifidobacteriaceae bacterium]|jgi:hypothetical protein|nr:hypothetical protein [Bifidobacteriaceae bacterium]
MTGNQPADAGHTSQQRPEPEAVPAGPAVIEHNDDRDYDDRPAGTETSADQSSPDGFFTGGFDLEPPPIPVSFNDLDADILAETMRELDAWVEQLREVWSLPAGVIPPYWHRHDCLIELLASLWTHYLGAFHPTQDASAPFGLWRDFEDWKDRMREQVAQVGTRLDSDRPARVILWPGQTPPEPADEPATDTTNRRADFNQHLTWRTNRRRQREATRLTELAARADPHTENPN